MATSEWKVRTTTRPAKDYDTTVARMAGNIAAGMLTSFPYRPEETIAEASVRIALKIVERLRAEAAVKRDE